LILADEPKGNLDLKTANEVFSLLKSLQQSNNTTLIVVTHSLEIAKNLDAVVELTKYGLTTRNL
jgi:ABC-type lipoprotein export system ATPase subunit